MNAPPSQWSHRPSTASFLLPQRRALSVACSPMGWAASMRVASRVGRVSGWCRGRCMVTAYMALAGIFIIEGLITVLVGAASYFLIPSWPAKTSHLTTREKAIIQHRLQGDSDAFETEGFQWSEVVRATKSLHVYGYCLLFHGFAFALYTLSLFLP